MTLLRKYIDSEYLFQDFSASLADSSSLETDWIEYSEFDKYQVEVRTETLGTGIDLIIESSNIEGGGRADDVTSTSELELNFLLFNAICRQRWIRIRLNNTSGSPVINCSLAVKAFRGSSDKLSVFPLSTDPTSFSQAALVQSVSKAQQPGGDYVNIPATGSVFINTDNLGTGETYTSSWIDTDGWDSVELFISSDVESDYNGIIIDFSEDVQAEIPVIRATNTYTYTQIDVERGFLILRFKPILDGFRVRYINNSDAQSSFIIDCVLRINTDSNLSNSAGALVTADFNTEVILGDVNGYISDTKFGNTKAIDSADGIVDIWALSSDTYANKVNRKTFPISNDNIYIVSTDATDTDEITLTYINSSGVRETSSGNLNGQTPVLIANGLDCNRAHLSESNGELAGNVYVMHGNAVTSGIPDDDTKILAFIPIGYGQTQQTLDRVPSDTKMIIKHLYINIARQSGSLGSAEILLEIKPLGGAWRVIRDYKSTTSNVIDVTDDILLDEGTLVRISMTEVSDSDTDCSAQFKYQLISK
jgi:hypothetical protein